MLSVALCSYNGEQYIREQLESILDQTMPVDEIVVCDDGSTDSTLSILQEYTHLNTPTIQLFSNNTTLGTRKNFQVAVDHCRGDIIFFADQDDLWNPDKVKDIVDYFKQHPSKKVVFTNGSLIDNKGESITSSDLWGLFFDNYYKGLFDHHLELESFLYENHATGASMAAKADFLRMNRFSEATSERILHDHIIALKAIEQDCLGYLEKKLIQYRLHEKQQRGVPQTPPSPVLPTVIPVAFHPAYYIVDQLTKPSCIQRATFLSYRLRSKHQIYGPLTILKDVGKYRKYYHTLWPKVMASDIKTSVCHTLSRFKRKLSHQ